jgi:poly-gamma-glutamate synthesis protein (capsule biosynthesis protein)
MIFLGDVASPTREHSTNFKSILTQNDHLFSNQTIVFNLEGMIADEVSLQTNSPILFNHSSVLEAFPNQSNLVAALANNHTLDLPDFYEATIEQLKAKNIPYFGAGKNAEESKRIVEISEDGKKFFLINACWDFLLYHQENPSRGVYINTIQEFEILNQVKQIKEEHPEAAVVVYFHWSFDLETLPFPMYRQFAMDLIDHGVNVVVGAHSHCVQGGESYKEGHIVYGLGNFYLPSHTFANGTLKFPEMSRKQMVLQWDWKTNQAICHWFNYSFENQKHTIEYLVSELLSDSIELKKYSPYQGMDHKTYVSFFRKNRRKKIAIPLFKSYKNNFQNKVNMFVLKNRALIARKMAEMKLIGWQN